MNANGSENRVAVGITWLDSQLQLGTLQCLQQLTGLLVANGYLPDILKEQQGLAGIPKDEVALNFLELGNERAVKFHQ